MPTLEQFRPAHVVREDADLFVRLRAGDEGALRTLIRRFIGPVHLLGGRVPDPDGFTERVFLTASARADEVEPGDDPASWLMTIASDVRAGFESGPTDVSGRLSPSIDQIVAAWTVRSAIESLDPVERSVAGARLVDGMTDAQIAERLHLGTESVEARAERAMRRLRNLLSHLDDVATEHPNGRAPVTDMLADPSMWADVPDGLEDRILHAARGRSESTVATTTTGRADSYPTPARSERSVASERSWLRSAAAGAAASLLLLFVGLVVFSALSGVDETDTFTVELISTGRVVDAGGSIDVTTVPSGIRVDVDVFGLPRRDAGRFYEGWFSMADGSMVSAGTFLEGGEFTLLGGVELDLADEFVITSESVGPGDANGQPASGDVVLRNRLDR